MQLHTLLCTFLALAITLPTASATREAKDWQWNDELKLYDIGNPRVTHWSKPHISGGLATGGYCGVIKKGGWGCGSVREKGVTALRGIFRCEKGLLKWKETCHEDSKNNRCVKNGRRKGKRFYPFVTADKVVCVNKKDI